MEILLHPVLRYWLAGAVVLLVAAGIAIHTTHPVVAAAVAGLGLGLIAGVTRPRRTPQAAREAEIKERDFVRDLTVFVGALDLPAIALDSHQAAVTFNAAAADLFPAIEAGAPMSRFSRHPQLMSTLTLVAKDGLQRAIEIVDHSPNGRRLKATAARLTPGADGDLEATVLVQFRDLSEQDRLAQMRSDFIANASHELRTPLASLRGFIETLQGPASQDENARAKFLEIMHAQSARMTRIVDDLLSLSRIEMRAHLPPTGQVDLNELLREVAQGLEPLAASSQIALRLHPSEGSCAVRGDRDELIQVFQNLVQNAIKYGHAGGHVDISLVRDAGEAGKRSRVRVSVVDDGTGIAAEHLPRLTERFYRVDTALSRARGGTGLGLAIVKHILNRHRGDLRIASELGQGSTFTVILDVAK